MRYQITIIIAGLLVGCASLDDSFLGDVGPASCEELINCTERDGIAIMGGDGIEQSVLDTAIAAAGKFEDVFLTPAPPVMIVSGGRITPELNAQIIDAGFVTALPWVTETDQALLRRNSVLEQVRAQTENLPLEQRERLEAAALAQLEARTASADNDTGISPEVRDAALSHELGHLWFINSFPAPDSLPDAGRGYGGWAPDWLDEMAAVLLENEALTQRRRLAFSKLGGDDLFPFEEFFQMEHPSYATAEALREKYQNGVARGGAQAIILSGDEAQEFLAESETDAPVNFYLQTRGLADYFTETTQDPTVFSDLATHFSQGGNIETWLVTRSDLPNTVEALETAWHDWRVGFARRLNN